MRSLLARLAFVGLVGAALVGCGTSSGTTLPAGSVANNSGGGPINSTNGVGAPPAGLVPALLIDDGTLSKGSYSGFNVVAADSQSAIQAASDPGAAIASPSDGTDAGSHQIGTVATPVTGNGLTQIILKYSGAVPNLTYQFGGFGNSTNFNYGTIVAHFWRNIRASSTVTIGGAVLTPTDVTVFIASQPVTYLAQVGVDTPATVAAGLAQLINQNTVVGPTGTLVQTYAFVNPATPTVLTIAPVTSGAGGNGITVTTAVTPGTVTATSSGSTAGGATVAGTQLPAPTWQLELVGNGANAGVGTVANTYDVRVTCTSADIAGTSPAPLRSVNRFTCPLPAYGTPSSNQNAPPPAAGVVTYTPGPNAILPGAAGAFTPINPTLYLVLTYATGTNAAQQDIIDVDYLYAIQ